MPVLVRGTTGTVGAAGDREAIETRKLAQRQVKISICSCGGTGII
jgi:hypothetical protein